MSFLTNSTQRFLLYDCPSVFTKKFTYEERCGILVRSSVGFVPFAYQFLFQIWEYFLTRVWRFYFTNEVNTKIAVGTCSI
jgi:hypothetical protein